MTYRFQIFDPSLRPRIEVLAKELAEYGLGIFAPHAHTDDGDLVALPPNLFSQEKDLRVSFVAQHAIDSNAIPVGWRWTGGSLEACAHCCGKV